ncbi:unnamed protein product [Bemisia tabaci]|uniref:Uncharacterized protein n=1 Tax=Bemisia tabaci TaxID=7038 RepID=A0A9P0A8I1_BEMTA|nr:unnamed protein product [Bemisia tabaci]
MIDRYLRAIGNSLKVNPEDRYEPEEADDPDDPEKRLSLSRSFSSSVRRVYKKLQQHRTEEEKWGTNLKNIIVPQTTVPHLKLQIKSKYTPVFFFNRNLKLTTLDKHIEGCMPKHHYLNIKNNLVAMQDGDVWSIGGRIYVKVEALKSGKLKKKMEEVLSFIKDKLNCQKYIYYLSNGSSNFSVQHLQGVDDSFKIKNIIVSITRNIPPHEDMKKEFSLKSGATREKGPQHRGERFITPRYLSTAVIKGTSTQNSQEDNPTSTQDSQEDNPNEDTDDSVFLPKGAPRTNSLVQQAINPDERLPTQSSESLADPPKDNEGSVTNPELKGTPEITTQKSPANATTSNDADDESPKSNEGSVTNPELKGTPEITTQKSPANATTSNDADDESPKSNEGNAPSTITTKWQFGNDRGIDIDMLQGFYDRTKDKFPEMVLLTKKINEQSVRARYAPDHWGVPEGWEIFRSAETAKVVSVTT